MGKLSWAVFAGILTLASISSAGLGAEKVGQAVKINTLVTGAEGKKTTGDAVYRDERVRANATGLGQFEFDDGTKLAIGPNANVTIDKYVLGEGGQLKKLTIRATKGSFRFIGGHSSSKAYTIITPAGTLGVRGTAAEVQVLPDGSVMVVQLEGTSEFCMNPQDRSTCRLLKNKCDFVVANRNTGQITDPEKISSEAVLAYGGPDSLPILQDNKELLDSFKFGNNECGLTKTAKALIENRPDNEPDQGSPD